MSVNVGQIRALIEGLSDATPVIMRGRGGVDLEINSDALMHDTDCVCDCTFDVEEHDVSLVSEPTDARVEAVLGIRALVFTVEVEQSWR